MTEMLAFVHIEKTAGTSLIHILRHNFFLRYLDVRPFRAESHGLFTPKDLRTARRLNPMLGAIGGHAVVPYNGLETEVGTMQYITLLRDPKKRYVSQYRHWVEKKKLDISFDEFLEHEELWNFQTRKLAGSDDLQAAKSALRDKFVAVGVVERFNEFLVLLKQALQRNDFDIRYSIQNTARDRSASDDLLAQRDEDIAERNANDLELYRFVDEELIPEQRQAVSGAFDALLAEFEASNMDGPRMHRRYIDYGFRKIYVEPLSGLVRKAGGLPFKGSY